MKNIHFKYPESPLSYKVILKTFNRDKIHPSNTIKYIETISTKKNTWSNDTLVLNRTNIVLNDSKDDDPISEILLITGSVLNNLEIEVSSTGQIFKIKNISKIRELWKEAKFKVGEIYKGDLIPRLISPMEKIITEENKLIQTLGKDPFFHYYFFEFFGLFRLEKARINHISRSFLFEDIVNVMSNIDIRENSDEMTELTINQQIFPEDVNKKQQSLIEKRGLDGSLDFDLKNNYHISDKGVISKIKIDHKMYWNQDIVKSFLLEVELKNV